MPDVGRPAQSFEPPPQFGIPDDPMRDAPIRRMTVPIIFNVSGYLESQEYGWIIWRAPVTKGGNTF